MVLTCARSSNSIGRMVALDCRLIIVQIDWRQGSRVIHFSSLPARPGQFSQVSRTAQRKGGGGQAGKLMPTAKQAALFLGQLAANLGRDFQLSRQPLRGQDLDPPAGLPGTLGSLVPTDDDSPAAG